MATQREVQVAIVEELQKAVDQYAAPGFSAAKLATAKAHLDKFLEKRKALLTKQNDKYLERQQGK